MSIRDRLIMKVLAKPVDELVQQALTNKDRSPDPNALLTRYALHGSPDRLHINPTAIVNNALFNVSGGEITVGEYAFFGHSVSVLTGTHDINQFGRKRQTMIVTSGRDVEIGTGAWLASHVIVLGPCVIGEHAVVAAGSLVIEDVDPYAVVAGRPARVVRRLEGRATES